MFGVKTDYITMVQELAYLRHIPRGSGGLAIDIGCGWGRMSKIFENIGYRAVGFDPDLDLLKFASSRGDGLYCAAALPDIPVRFGSADLAVLQNLLRPLHLVGKLESIRGIGRYMRPGGHVVVVDNIRTGHGDYVSEEVVSGIFAAEGLSLQKRITLRVSRRLTDYLMQLGLVPRRLAAGMAARELERSSRSSGASRWRYSNVMFVFRRA
ncbi:MAG: methyltransferase domain-containing protein [Candidatus Fermentibacter sp.]|nr:methyltransferase domain-containing protein [Candidatus Fermentibacter sp.]